MGDLRVPKAGGRRFESSRAHLTDTPKHRESVDTGNLPRVYLVVNGPLGMTPGKIAAQTFQACERLYVETRRLEQRVVDHLGIPSSRAWTATKQILLDWEKHTTTIALVATTPKMFKRVCAEVPGVVMVDEGHTEVPPGSATVFASWPIRRADAPKLLSNAKIPLL